MKTIKVIDLLNKVLNGEELPKKIKIRGYWFKLSDNYKEYNINYVYEDNFDNYWLDNVRVDEEVIIEEENKKIEKWNYDKDCTDEWNFEEIKEKLDELVDAVNKLKEKVGK